MKRATRRVALAGGMAAVVLASATLARGAGERGEGNDGDGGARPRPSASAATPLENKKALAKLAIYPPTIRLRGAADRQGFVVQATYADGTTADVTRSVRARVADEAVARLAGRTTSRPSCRSSCPSARRRSKSRSPPRPK